MTKNEGERLYLDDLHVGQRWASRTHRIDAEQIKAFAAEFDPQHFHLSEEGAAGTLFGSLAASGWHTAALTMRLLVESVPLADGLVGAELQLAWPKPTRCGGFCRPPNSPNGSPRSCRAWIWSLPGSAT